MSLTSLEPEARGANVGGDQRRGLGQTAVDEDVALGRGDQDGTQPVRAHVPGVAIDVERRARLVPAFAPLAGMRRIGDQRRGRRPAIAAAMRRLTTTRQARGPRGYERVVHATALCGSVARGSMPRSGDARVPECRHRAAGRRSSRPCWSARPATRTGIRAQSPACAASKASPGKRCSWRVIHQEKRSAFQMRRRQRAEYSSSARSLRSR